MKNKFVFFLLLLVFIPFVAFAEPAHPKQDGSLPVLMTFGLDQCLSCKEMKPVIKEIQSTYYSDFTLNYIDVWKNKAEATRFSIRGIPAHVFLDRQGNEIDRRVGHLSTKEILDIWSSHGYYISKYNPVSYRKQ